MEKLWAGVRSPVTLLGGVLGAGKTTLLNRLLAEADGRRLVILVNDVGDIAVDAALIASATDDVVELTNGCVCCSMTDGLGEALEDLRQLPEPPDHVIVELSGVAEPARVAPWATTTGFRLDAVVVCVDAERIGRQLTDRWMADTVHAQLRAADLLVLTKADLVDRQPDLTPYTTAPILDARSLPLSVFLASERTRSRPLEAPPKVSVDWVVSSVRLPNPIDPVVFRLLLAELPAGIIRVKGFVGDSQGEHWIVQGVGERRTLHPVSGDIAGDRDGWGVVAIASPAMTGAQLDSALASLASTI